MIQHTSPLDTAAPPSSNPATLRLALFTLATVLHGLCWWIADSESTIDTLALPLAGGILLINAILTWRFSYQDKLLSVIFGGAAVFSQLFLIILLLMTQPGGVQ